jgi:alcohol dehydrogenase class IV
MTILNFGDWPGRIISGPGAVRRLSEVVANAGTKRALVVCGATVAAGEILQKVKAGLGTTLADVFAEAAAHTPVEMVKRGVERSRATGSDALVSVGGGSTIDAGKAIAIMLSTGGDLTPYAVRYSPGGEMSHKPISGRPVVHVAVPTTAGSASDVMPTAACRDPHTRQKLLFWDQTLIPSATVLDPELAVHADSKLTAATGMTAVARCVESIYSGRRHPISTALALHALRLLRDALPRSVRDPGDLDARAACQFACVMSGMAAINAMVSVVHAVGHVVGGRLALQHGTSHAILLASAARKLLPVIGDQQSLLLDSLGGQSRGIGADDDGAQAVQKLTEFTDGLPLPHHLRDVGISESDLSEVARMTMSDYMMANLPRPMAETEVLALLRDSW